jgi:hypothetical protein
MMLPLGVRQLTTYEEVRAAWGDLLTIAPEDGEEEGEVLFANNPRVAIAADAVYVQIRRAVHAGPNAELTEVLRITEPNVGHLRLTDRHKGEIEKAICLLTAICGIPAAEVNQMSSGDFRLCGEVVGAFLSE